MRDIPIGKPDLRLIQYCTADDDPCVTIGYENPYHLDRPRFFSLEDYYNERLLYLIQSSLREGVMDGLIPVRRVTQKIPKPSNAFLEDFELIRIDASAEEGAAFRVDVIIKAQIEIAMNQSGKYISDKVEQWYRMPFICSIGTNERSIEQLPPTIYERNERAPGKALDQYLIPVIHSNELDEIAARLLMRYYPEALVTPMPVDGRLLAERMGFEIEQAAITADRSILGQFFFEEETTNIYSPDASAIVEKHIQRNTMLIDTAAATARGVQREEDTIVHECIHGCLDKRPYLLQKAYNEDMKCLSCAVEPSRESTNEKSPIQIIEKRTVKLTPRVRMPAAQTKIKINELLIKYGIHAEDGLRGNGRAREMGAMVTELATFYRVSKKCAKLRMIELGYECAAGVLNYVNGHYAPWHCAAHTKLRWNQTFTISIQDAAREYAENPRFAELINTGHYLYVEGHFCIRDASFIFTDRKNTIRLTDYARSHMDECCLLFEIRNRQPAARHEEGRFLREDTLNWSGAGFVYGSLNQSVDKIAAQKLIKEAQKVNQIRASLPSLFSDTLAAHMKRLNVTREDLEERSGLSGRMLTRMRNDEGFRKTMRQVVALCIGMHLEPELSEDLMSKSGICLMKTDEHALYGVLLRTMYGCSIFACNAVMQEAGLKPFAKEE